MSKLRSEPDGGHTISPYQAFVLMYQSMYGVGVLSLPRDVGKFTGNDLLWVIVLSGLTVWGIVMLNTWLCQRFPGMTIMTYAPRILGNDKREWVGKVLTFPILAGLGIFWIMGMSISTRVFGEVVVTGVLVQTPIEAVILVFLIACAIAGGSHPTNMAKFNEFMFPFTLIPILLLVIALVQRGELANLFPLGEAHWPLILRGVVSATYSFAGYKILLIFSGYYAKPYKSYQSHSTAMLSVTFIYWFACLTSLSVFGKDEINNILYPVWESIKVVYLKELFFERMESAILAIWLIAVFCSITNLLMSLVQALMDAFHLHEKWRRWLSFSIVPIVYFIAMIPQNIKVVGVYASRQGIFALMLALSIPAILLPVSLIRKKKGESPSETTAS
ncbi:GerAB/ArcD/ProY family transporter [Laceyella tengchongensis]|uniref:GerAB/ArcD/ProY family transporter n=1 Tax=Laceyella tengchongensis TaxID=574699 RepID=UPI00188DFD66